MIKINSDKNFNKYVLRLFMKFYAVKKHAYKHKLSSRSHFTYSQKLIAFITKEVERKIAYASFAHATPHFPK